MNVVKGIYRNGTVELLEKPDKKGAVKVLVVFPEKKKKIAKIGGLFKGHSIDFVEVEIELKKLGNKSKKHILDEA